MDENNDKVLQELRIIRKLLLRLNAEIASIKPVIAAAAVGGVRDMTGDQICEKMSADARELMNQFSEFDVEESDEESS